MILGLNSYKLQEKNMVSISKHNYIINYGIDGTFELFTEFKFI